MDTERSEKRLAAAALLFRCLMWFPVWVLLLQFAQANDEQQGQLNQMFFFLQELPLSHSGGGHILRCALLLLCVSYPVTLWSRFWKLRCGKVYYLRGKILTLLLLIPAVCGTSYLLVRATGSTAIPVLLTCVTLCVLAAGADKPADTLFAPAIFGAYLALTVCAVLFLRLAHFTVPMTWFLTVTCVQTVGFFLLRNQFMLRRLVNRRSNVETEVPPDIRKINLLLSCLIFSILLGALIFREPLGDVLRFMEAVAAGAVRLLLTGFYKLVNFLGGDTPGYTEFEEAADETAVTPEGKLNPLWLLLWIPLLLAAYRVWQVFVSEWVYNLRMALGRLIRRLRGQNEPAADRAVVKENAGYTDTETRAEKQPTARQAKKAWRKELRAWKKLPDSTEKFYAGYQLLLRAPAWKGDVPRASETVREIETHWADLHGGGLGAVTEDFQMHRYAELTMPAGAIAEMEKALISATQ